MLREIVIGLLAAVLMIPGCLAEGETAIVLGEQITVNGAVITQDTSAAVYLDHRIETHEDVPGELQGIENRVVTITDGGIYRVSGEGKDLQLRVDADADNEVRIVLEGAKITCRTAPAIAVISAADPREAGKYGVTIELARGASDVSGSHTEKAEDMDVKLSGAITSLVSLGFEGEGFLTVDADNEGIEVKNGHMTFNGGNIIVNSGDDPLNASEDGISVITVNDGTLHLQVKPLEGGEGDGIDSNGSIVVNGGMVASYAHPDSMDSGIDSDLGCAINGGIVLGAGNMYDEISPDSEQLFMVLQFAQKINEMIVVTDTEGNLEGICEANRGNLGKIEEFDADISYTSFVISSPDLKEGDYHLYLGGEFALEGDELVYTPGKQLQHGGMMGDRMAPGDMHRPEGMPEMPGGMQKPDDMPEPPEGMEFPEGMQPPQMGRFDPGDRGQGGGKRGRGFGGDMAPTEASTIFHLAPGSTMFSGITAVKE